MNYQERIYKSLTESSLGYKRLRRVVRAKYKKVSRMIRGKATDKDKMEAPLRGRSHGWAADVNAARKDQEKIQNKAVDRADFRDSRGDYEEDKPSRNTSPLGLPLAPRAQQGKDAAHRARMSSFGSRASGMIRRGRSFKEFKKTMQTTKAKTILAKEKRRATNRDIGRKPTQGETLKAVGGKNVHFAKERHKDEIADKSITKKAKEARLKRVIRVAGKAQQDDSSKHQ